mmetsp:Transcript_12025/g.39492  ORF Transcript_12025/g.39492 Transcript_12025/m.39492 type:complete len:247 (+) Transcript_12025:1628-2368(+)
MPMHLLSSWLAQCSWSSSGESTIAVISRLQKASPLDASTISASTLWTRSAAGTASTSTATPASSRYSSNVASALAAAPGPPSASTSSVAPAAEAPPLAMWSASASGSWTGSWALVKRQRRELTACSLSDRENRRFSPTLELTTASSSSGSGGCSSSAGGCASASTCSWGSSVRTPSIVPRLDRLCHAELVRRESPLSEAEDGSSAADGARASCRSEPPASMVAVRSASIRPMSSAAFKSTPSFSSP